MPVEEPLSPAQLQEYLRESCKSGIVLYLKHATQRMNQRRISEADVRNVIKRGWCYESPEFERDWKYAVQTERFKVILFIDPPNKTVIVTAFQRRPK